EEALQVVDLSLRERLDVVFRVVARERARLPFGERDDAIAVGNHHLRERLLEADGGVAARPDGRGQELLHRREHACEERELRSPVREGADVAPAETPVRNGSRSEYAPTSERSPLTRTVPFASFVFPGVDVSSRRKAKPLFCAPR